MILLGFNNEKYKINQKSAYMYLEENEMDMFLNEKEVIIKKLCHFHYTTKVNILITKYFWL